MTYSFLIKAPIIGLGSALQQRRLDALVSSDLRPLILAASTQGPTVGISGLGLGFGFRDFAPALVSSALQGFEPETS